MADPQKVQQLSFSGGEISPELHGRADLGKYGVGLKKAFNFIIRPQGGADNRPGMQFVTSMYELGNEDFATRFIPFDVADNDSFLLLFGEEKIWFLRFGAVTTLEEALVGGRHTGSFSETAGAATDVLVLTSPWGADEIGGLKFAQSNDVMTICHPSHPVYELRRFGFFDWALFELDFQPNVEAPTNVVATANVDLTVPEDVADPVIYNRTYHYKVSAISADDEESLESLSDDCVNDLSWRGNTNTISWTAVAGAKEYVVYKAENSVFGFIGITPDTSFVDRNYQPQFTDTPKEGKVPFDDEEAYPAVVDFHQQRRVFAAPTEKPQTITLSASGQYDNFNVSRPAKDGDAIEVTIAAKRRQEIYHLVSLEELLIFTQSGEWKMVGANGDDILTPASVDLRPQSSYGSSKLVHPLVIGSRILFIQSLGKTIYDYGYQVTENRYTADDLSILARHLFDNRQIVSWDYDYKKNLLWMAMSDGKALCMTYHRGHELWAVTQHETDGFIEDVSIVPEIDDYVTYFVVTRKNINRTERFVEKLHSREFSRVEDSFFVDSGLSYDNPQDIEGITFVSGGVSARITVTGHGFLAGNFVRFSEVGGLELLNDDTGLYGEFQVIEVNDENTFTINFSNEDRSEWEGTGKVRDVLAFVTGMEHLAGREVVALVDGHVYGDAGELSVDEFGAVQLPQRGSTIHVGLPYLSQLETLDLDLEVNQNIPKGVMRSVGRLVMKVQKTRGLEVGPNFDDLREIFPRDYEGYEHPSKLHTDTLEVHMSPEWKNNGLLVVQQKYPLPASVLSIIPEITYGT